MYEFEVSELTDKRSDVLSRDANSWFTAGVFCFCFGIAAMAAVIFSDYDVGWKVFIFAAGALFGWAGVASFIKHTQTKKAAALWQQTETGAIPAKIKNKLEIYWQLQMALLALSADYRHRRTELLAVRGELDKELGQ